jgi:predicted phage-related endonuclease
VGSYRLQDWDQGIPDYYWIQAQYQLAVSGLPLCHVVALVGGQDLRWRRVEADPDWQAMAFEEAAKFWGYVEGKTPPAVDGSEATRKAISSQYMTKTTDAVECGIDLSVAVSEYLDAQAAEKVAKTAKTKAQNVIQLLVREHEVGLVDGEPFVSIKALHRSAYEVAPTDYARMTVLKGAKR